MNWKENEEGYMGECGERKKGRKAAIILISKQSRGNYERVTADGKPVCPSRVL